MKRTLTRLVLLTFLFSSIASVSRAEVCVSPRIKRAKACGTVIDPYGMVIPNANIAFGAGAPGKAIATDEHGKFSAAAEGAEVRLRVSAIGFQSVETYIGKLRPAPSHCKKPLFVMLTIGDQGCAMISSRKSELLLAKKE